jgi:AcrR family transcriptional regulator
VSDAILDATADLAASEGLSAVTMSRIAEDAGIGRATLYKYFADIQQILIAWHRRQIDSHLEQLAAVRTSAADPGEALRAVLLAYGEIIRTRHGHALASLLHGLPHVRHDGRRGRCSQAGKVRRHGRRTRGICTGGDHGG